MAQELNRETRLEINEALHNIISKYPELSEYIWENEYCEKSILPDLFSAIDISHDIPED